ncbi:MAG: type IV pilus modification protein PilV [Psychrobacter alimentarius]
MNVSKAQRGVGLIEVMVALLLLMVAVLGYSALQGQAIKTTNESLERSQSLIMMRTIAEKIHANPSAIATYESGFNASGIPTAPSKRCGLDGVVATTLCTPAELAAAESFKIRSELQNYDFQIQMHPCPNTGGTGTSASTNIMFSYCLISAWGNTTPTIGTNADVDCLTSRVANNNVVEVAGGSYHPKSTCMMMEI